MTARWFLLPIATDERGGQYPKYTQRDGAEGFSGNIYDTSGVDVVPDGEFYIVRVFGETEVLDAIESESDAETMDTLGLSKAEVTGILNDEFNAKRSFDEWEQRFKTGDV